jgi:hypothetical protein
LSLPDRFPRPRGREICGSQGSRQTRQGSRDLAREQARRSTNRARSSGAENSSIPKGIEHGRLTQAGFAVERAFHLKETVFPSTEVSLGAFAPSSRDSYTPITNACGCAQAPLCAETRRGSRARDEDTSWTLLPGRRPRVRSCGEAARRARCPPSLWRQKLRVHAMQIPLRLARQPSLEAAPRDRSGTGFHPGPSAQRRDKSWVPESRPLVRSRSAPPVHRATRAELRCYSARTCWVSGGQGPTRDQLRAEVRMVAQALRANSGMHAHRNVSKLLIQAPILSPVGKPERWLNRAERISQRRSVLGAARRPFSPRDR